MIISAAWPHAHDVRNYPAHRLQLRASLQSRTGQCDFPSGYHRSSFCGTCSILITTIFWFSLLMASLLFTIIIIALIAMTSGGVALTLRPEVRNGSITAHLFSRQSIKWLLAVATDIRNYRHLHAGQSRFHRFVTTGSDFRAVDY